MVRGLHGLAVMLPLAVGCGSAVVTTGRGGGPPDLDYPVGEFALTERSGKSVTDQDLRGKVWVAAFVFTRCMGPCPAVTGTMARLQAELPADPDLRLVTLTVDPARDDPAELRRYADKYRADPGRWLFLTGDEKTVHTLMRDRFKLAVGRKDGPDVKPGDEFDHSTRLAVVDRAGVIRGTFDGMPPDGDPGRFEEGLARLKAKVATLLAR